MGFWIWRWNRYYDKTETSKIIRYVGDTTTGKLLKWSILILIAIGFLNVGIVHLIGGGALLAAKAGAMLTIVWSVVMLLELVFCIVEVDDWNLHAKYYHFIATVIICVIVWILGVLAIATPIILYSNNIVF